MKVVFLQDIPNIARAGEMKDVADGYGRNYLIPNKLAAQADPRMMQQIESQIKARVRLAAQTESEMQALAGQLEGKEVVLKAKVGLKDRLYGSITPADIVAELDSTLGIVIDRRKIEMENPIRQVGSYEVPIRLSKDIIPRITLTVVEEES